MAKTAFAAAQLRSFVERIERLTSEKDAISADIKEVVSEAKSMGFCTKTMRKIIAARKLDEADRQEAEAMYELYADALGMTGTPLGDYSDKIAAE